MIDNLRKAIRDKLVAANVNGGVRIYFDVAKQGAAYPYIVITLATSNIITEDEADIYEDVWDVTAFTPSAEASRSLMTAIKDALHRQPLTITNGHHIWTAAQTAIRLTEIVDDTRIYRAGWDIFIQSQDKS